MGNVIRNIVIILIIGLLSACTSEDSKDDKKKPVPTGMISGTVLNAAASNTNASPVPLSAVNITLSDANNNLVGTTTSNENGEFEFTVLAESGYSLSFALDGFYSVDYYNIDVQNNETTILDAVLQIDNTVTGTGTLTGLIINAVDSNPIQGATLNFREGLNIRTGTITATTQTDANGIYTISALSTGNYTCEILLSGYITVYTNVYVLGNVTRDQQNASLSPVLNQGEIRITLNWGATPLDLDSHLTGPISENSPNRFHVYYAAKGQAGDDVILDRDDTDSFGPETTTIYIQHPGLYRYSVYDYSNGTPDSETNPVPTSSTALSESSATVRLETNQGTRVFNVPSGEGTLWTVFELDGTTVNAINSMSYETSSTAIQNMPEKSPLLQLE